MLELVDDARATGQDVTFDAYPYEWASTRLLILIPIWVQDGGPARTKERLADRAVRDADPRRADEARPALRGRRRTSRRPDRPARPAGEPCAGRAVPLGELIDDRGDDPVDVLCDLLLEENLRPNEVTPGPHTDGIRRFLRHPIGMVGTDSTFVGDKPSPRTYGSYPRILGQFVRDEGILGLEEAIRRMTTAAGRPSRAARSRRDPRRRRGATSSSSTRRRSGATRRSTSRGATRSGIETVIVNGVPVVDGGRHTGATPGRALRRGRD